MSKKNLPPEGSAEPENKGQSEGGSAETEVPLQQFIYHVNPATNQILKVEELNQETGERKEIPMENYYDPYGTPSYDYEAYGYDDGSGYAAYGYDDPYQSQSEYYDPYSGGEHEAFGPLPFPPRCLPPRCFPPPPPCIPRCFPPPRCLPPRCLPPPRCIPRCIPPPRCLPPPRCIPRCIPPPRCLPPPRCIPPCPPPCFFQG